MQQSVRASPAEERPSELGKRDGRWIALRDLLLGWPTTCKRERATAAGESRIGDVSSQLTAAGVARRRKAPVQRVQCARRVQPVSCVSS